MATPLTQARGLLTAAELELFDRSRAQNIKSFTGKQVGSMVGRTRKLRDKYRDLYQRQTATSRKKPGGSYGDANARTQRKGEIFDEVLTRFSARANTLAAQEARAAKKATPSRAANSAAPAKKTAAKSSPAGGASGKTMTVRKAVKRALASKKGAAQSGDRGGAERSSKAPSKRSPTASAKAPPIAAPLDIVPKAKRSNPIKRQGGNIGIDAHNRVQVRHAQAKRDAR